MSAPASSGWSAVCPRGGRCSLSTWAPHHPPGARRGLGPRCRRRGPSRLGCCHSSRLAGPRGARGRGGGRRGGRVRPGAERWEAREPRAGAGRPAPGSRPPGAPAGERPAPPRGRPTGGYTRPPVPHSRPFSCGRRAVQTGELRMSAGVTRISTPGSERGSGKGHSGKFYRMTTSCACQMSKIPSTRRVSTCYEQ